MDGFDKIVLVKVPDYIIDAGCEVVYERIAEAFEPEFRALIARAFMRMQEASHRGPPQDARRPMRKVV